MRTAPGGESRAPQPGVGLSGAPGRFPLPRCRTATEQPLDPTTGGDSRNQEVMGGAPWQHGDYSRASAFPTCRRQVIGSVLHKHAVLDPASGTYAKVKPEAPRGRLHLPGKRSRGPGPSGACTKSVFPPWRLTACTLRQAAKRANAAGSAAATPALHIRQDGGRGGGAWALRSCRNVMCRRPISPEWRATETHPHTIGTCKI
jgi:hypothetical protein